MLTKQHFNHAASMVRAILKGQWSNEFPCWADEDRNTSDVVVFGEANGSDHNYTRAVHTAEAFSVLFQGVNPRFNEQKFLQACGLLPDTAGRRAHK